MVVEKLNYEDLFNIYAVHFGYRPGALIGSNYYLAKELKLALNNDLVHTDYRGHKAPIGTDTNWLVTKKKVTAKGVTEKGLGDLLGYFCSGHPHWWDSDTKRISVHIRFKIGNRHITPFPMMCADSKMTKHNARAFIASLETIRAGYAEIAKYMGVTITAPKIVLKKYGFGTKTPKTLTPAQYLKWKCQ